MAKFFMSFSRCVRIKAIFQIDFCFNPMTVFKNEKSRSKEDASISVSKIVYF